MSHFFQATWLHTSIYSHKRSSGRNGWAPALVRCCWLLLRLLTKWCHPVISWFINHSKYRYIYHKAYLLDLQTNLPKYGAPPCKDCFLIPKKKNWWTWWDWHHWCWQRMDPISDSTSRCETFEMCREVRSLAGGHILPQGPSRLDLYSDFIGVALGKPNHFIARPQDFGWRFSHPKLWIWLSLLAVAVIWGLVVLVMVHCG